jgi:sporulation protein YlmC with PRC-barrel domain
MSKHIWIVTALVAAPLAANAQTKEPAPTGSTGQTGQTTGQAPNTPPQTTSSQISVRPGEKVMGTEIKTQRGESLGKVEDLVVSPDGRISYAVVSYSNAAGGAPGAADRRTLVPWHLVQTGQAETLTGRPAADAPSHYVVAIERSRLSAAPSFGKDEWPKDSMAFGEVDKYYANDRAPGGRPIEASARISGTNFLRGTQITHREVVDASGKRVGAIKSVALDPDNGRVSYVALEAGGRVVAVPWQSLRSTRQGEKDVLTLSASEQQLAGAPEFKSGAESWREMSDPGYVRRVYQYYSVRPYWSERSMDDRSKDPVGDDMDKDKDKDKPRKDRDDGSRREGDDQKPPQ